MFGIALPVLEAYASIAAAVFAAATFTLGMIAASRILLRRRANRIRVERYLRAERDRNTNKGQRSALEIAIQLGLLEDQVVEAALVSRRIARWTKTDEHGFAVRMLLSFDPKKRATQH